MKKKGDQNALFGKIISEWKWLLGYAKRYKAAMLLYVLIGILATLMSLAVSVAAKHLIDAVVAHDGSQLVRCIIPVILLSVFHHVFQAVSSWFISVTSTKVNNEIRSEIYSHMLKARWKDISIFHSGELLNRLESDVNSVSGGAVSFIPGVITKFVQFAGALVIVLYYDKTMALLALMSAPFLFVSSKFLIRTIRKYNKKARELNGQVLSYTEESVQNIQLIKAFDLTKDYIADFSALLSEYRNVKLSYDKFSILTTLCLSLIGVAVSYSCYGLGIYRLWQGAISFGTMTMFLQLSGTLTSSFSSLASLVPSAVATATSAGRIMEITGFAEEEDADKEKALAMKKASAESGVSLEMQNVFFRYEDDEDFVLKNISLTVSPGETIAFTGPSGEGKTTVLKLILGLTVPTQGEIYIRNSENEILNVSDSTRRFLSYVPQTVNVFSGTIADNLRIVKKDATDEELYSLLKTVELYEFVTSLPQGLDTVINESGNNFSQGQLQRIAIARALLRDARIILLDEATSALDTETESTVLSNIMTCSPSKICILTTHRESMLKYCDRIYKINADGKMTECLTSDENKK